MSEYPYALNLTFTASCKYGKKNYLSCNCFNGLFSIDEEGKIEHIGRFPNETTFKRNIHHRAFVYDKKIFFVPGYGSSLAIYDPNTNVIESVNLGNLPSFRGMDSIVFEENLWIFPADVNLFPICIDLKSMEVSYAEKYREIVSEDIKKKGAIFNGTLSFDGKAAWASVWGTHFLYKFDLEHREQQIIDIGDDSLCVAGVTYNNGNLYFTTLDDLSIFSFDINGKSIRKYSVDDIPLTERRLKYCNILSYKNQVIVLPETGEWILELDELEQRFSKKYRIPETIFSVEDSCRTTWRRFLYYSIERNNLLIYPFKTNGSILIDLNDGEVSSEEFVFNKNDIDYIFDQKYRTNISKEILDKEIVKETYLINLERFIEAVEES